MREFDAELDVLEQVVAGHLGLSRTDSRALEIIERRHGTTPGQLAHDLGFTRSAVTVVINRLETAGLAERRLSAADRRRLALHVTPEGRALVRGLFAQLAGKVGCALDGMSESELDTVSRFLHDMTVIAADFRTHLAAVDQA